MHVRLDAPSDRAEIDERARVSQSVREGEHGGDPRCKYSGTAAVLQGRARRRSDRRLRKAAQPLPAGCHSERSHTGQPKLDRWSGGMLEPNTLDICRNRVKTGIQSNIAWVSVEAESARPDDASIEPCGIQCCA